MIIKNIDKFQIYGGYSKTNAALSSSIRISIALDFRVPVTVYHYLNIFLSMMVINSSDGFNL